MGTLIQLHGRRARAVRRTQSECVSWEDDIVDSRENAANDELDFTDISMGSKLAEGAFGEVYRGRLFGKEVAVKVIKGNNKGNGKIMRTFAKEVEIMKTCRHPNVVEFLGACHNPQRLCIVTAFYERGSLGSFMARMRKEKKTVSVYFVVKTGLMIAQGLAWLHQKGIIHRDLKPDNVLLDRGDNVRLCDFGVSHALLPMFPSAHNFYGSPPYTAPEVIDRQEYGVSADVYSFGCLMIAMLKCGDPFDYAQMPAEDEGGRELMKRVVQGLRPSVPKGTDATVHNIIKSCFKPAAHRPTAEQLATKLANCLSRMETVEQDILDLANPSLAKLFQDKERSIETLQVRLDVSDKALKEETAAKQDLAKKNQEQARALRHMERELEQLKKKLANKERKDARKAAKAAARAANAS